MRFCTDHTFSPFLRTLPLKKSQEATLKKISFQEIVFFFILFVGDLIALRTGAYGKLASRPAYLEDHTE